MPESSDRFKTTTGRYIAYGSALVVDAVIAYGAYRLLRHNDVRLLSTLPVTTVAAVVGIVPAVAASFTLADVVERLFSRRGK